MLKRVLEPEVMDTPQEAIDYDSMDHSEVNRQFVADLLAAGYASGEVLDLGTGTAQIPIELCRQNSEARVYAVDMAESMLDMARGNVELESLTGQIQLDLVDAKELPLEGDRFACVMSNSIVHHIPEPAGVLAEAVRVTAPGGLIFFRDLARPESQQVLDQQVATYAGDANEHQRKMFAESLHAALSLDEVQALVTALGFDADTVRMTSDRHWTWIAHKPESRGDTASDAATTTDTSAPAVEESLDDAEMTASELAEAQQYGRWDLYCDLVDRGLDLAYLTCVALFAAIPLDTWLRGFAWLDSHASLRVAAMFLIVISGHILVSLPLSYFSGYVLEHRFGLSTQSRRGWFAHYAKAMGLTVGFGVLMMVGLYWIIWMTGSWWWLVAGGAVFVLSVVIGQLAPVLILPLFYKIERLDAPELSARLERISRGTGLNIEGVYRMGLSDETQKANAMLAGLGRTRRVLLGDTMLEKFSPDEIEVIFGHEIGHHVHGHIYKMILTGAAYCIVGFWLCNLLLLGQLAAHDPTATLATLPPWTVPWLMLAITLFSMVTEPLKNIVSRHYERQCDRYALEKTGLADAYRSAFRKLARLNKDDPHPHPVAVFLLHSHPPIAERLAMADGL